MFVARSSQRYPINAEVSFKTEAGDPKTIAGKALDLGLTGCGILLKESIPVSTIIHFDLSADYLTRHMLGVGKIVNLAEQKPAYGGGFRIGVQFTQVEEEIIVDFINVSQRMAKDEKRRQDEARKRRRGSSEYGPI